MAFSCEGVKDVLLLKFRKRKQTSTFCWRQKASCSSWWSSMAWQAGAWGFGFSDLFFLFSIFLRGGIFLSSGSCNRNVCSACLFSNRYSKIWGCVPLLTLNYSLTDLSVSQRSTWREVIQRIFMQNASWVYDIPGSFQILLTQLRDGRSCIVSKGQIKSLNKYLNESRYLLLANPFPCCFRPHLSWDELGAGH